MRTCGVRWVWVVKPLGAELALDGLFECRLLSGQCRCLSRGLDDRFAETEAASHSNQSVTAIPVADSKELLGRVGLPLQRQAFDHLGVGH